ncbi:MAG: sulfite exporter TauE/SafE family protein [Chthoniobacterales bacterium]|nr:sulfite exporter TauE/SafE family protein [Chthoniobacterales bacterium]
MMILALFLALGIGISLGLLGSGGSIITLPVLVYVANVPAAEAVPMSLAVVGGTTLVASIFNARSGHIHGKAALLFSATGVIGALGGSQLTPLVSQPILLLIFAGLMLVVGLLMFKPRADRGPDARAECHWVSCTGTGLCVGFLTGFLGVGGGFLIVPALLFLARVPLKRAIATSLVVITVTSAAGLIGHLRRTHFDWSMARMFLALAVIGMLAGRKFASHLETERLRYWFAGFVLAVAVFVLAENWKVFR